MTWEMTLLVERNKGKDEGKAEGAILKLIDQIQKKTRKGKTLDTIVDELESDSATITPIYEAVKKAPVDADPEQVLAAYMKAGTQGS